MKGQLTFGCLCAVIAFRGWFHAACAVMLQEAPLLNELHSRGAGGRENYIFDSPLRALPARVQDAFVDAPTPLSP